MFQIKKKKYVPQCHGNSLVVQCSGLGTFTAVGPSSFLDQGTTISQGTQSSQKKKVCSTASQKKLQQNYPNPNAFTRKSTCVCFLLTSPKIINNRISSNSWNLAGGEQHSELIHIQRSISNFMNRQFFSIKTNQKSILTKKSL